MKRNQDGVVFPLDEATPEEQRGEYVVLQAEEQISGCEIPGDLRDQTDQSFHTNGEVQRRIMQMDSVSFTGYIYF